MNRAIIERESVVKDIREYAEKRKAELLEKGGNLREAGYSYIPSHMAGVAAGCEYVSHSICLASTTEEIISIIDVLEREASSLKATHAVDDRNTAAFKEGYRDGIGIAKVVANRSVSTFRRSTTSQDAAHA